MSTTSKLTISFKNPNKTTNGASNATEYKIYKGVREDPCPEGIPVGDAVNSGPITDLSDITFTDDDTIVSNPYFYRVSWIRNDEEILGSLLGPLLIPSLYELGYPNNFPSNTSGNPNFVDIEPMFHYNAAWHDCFLSADQNRADLNDFPYGLKNHSRRYANLTQSVSNVSIGKGIDDNETPCFSCTDDVSNTTYNSLNLTDLRRNIIDRWAENGLELDENEIGEIIFDEGITAAFVFFGGSRWNLNNPDDSSSDIKDADAEFMDNSSGHKSISLFSAKTSFRRDGRPNPYSIKPRLFSSGEAWQDENPPFGQADPDEPGWMPKLSYHFTGIDWSLTRSSSTGYFNHWLNYSLGGNQRLNGSYDPAGFRIANNSSGMDDLKPLWCDIIEHKSINVMVATYFPDGTWKFFVNGVLQIEEAPTNVLLGANTSNGSSYNISTVANIWYTQTASEFYQKSIEDYGVFKIPFQPVAHITLPAQTTNNDLFSSVSSIKPFFAGKTVDWCEYLLFPKALDKKNLLRLNNYFQSKYSSSISSWHGNYFGY
jgi:hypothetical protein